MNIGKFSVRNSVLVTIMMISVLVLGFLSLARLPREQFSEVPFFWANIIVPYPGVSAFDIEQTVTIPVETEFQGIDRLKQIQSVTTEGLSVVRVEFDDGISNDEFDRLFQEVRTRFGRVSLPDGTLPALIDDFSSSDFLPVIEVVVSGSAGYAEINRQATALAERIKKVPQAADADLVGSRDRRVLIEADRNRMESLGLSLGELIRTIQAQNATVPGGTLGTESREYLLRTVGRVDSVEQFGAVIVRRGTGSGEGIVRVRDVAAVTEGFDDRGIYARFNGEEAVAIRVSKVARGNSIAVIDGVKKTVEEFRETLGPGIEITLSGDSTVQIRDSIRVLLNNAVFGLLLLTVILFLFVGIRNALMTALGIPVTFAITFLILEAFGETLNSNTLFGLVLVLGLIVDHAIVITENSYRLQQQGLSRHDAAIEGTNQVVLPVIAGTATTVAAFLPLMILPGTIGKFLRVIPFTVSIALLASTFEAIVFLPSHYADWPGGKVKKDMKERFDKVRALYRRLLERVYRRKGLSVLILSAAALGIFSIVPLLKQDLFSAEDFSNFTISIELAPGSPVSRTSLVVGAFEERIIPLVGNGEVVSVSSSIGLSSGSSGNSAKSNIAEITVNLTETSEGRSRSVTEIMTDVRTLTAGIPGPEEVRFEKATNGPPTDSPVSFRIFGDSYEDLAAVSAAIQEKLREYPVLLNVTDNLERSTPELRIVLKPERASAYGIDAFSLGTYIRDSFEGRIVTTYFRDNEEIDVIVKYAEAGSPSVALLDSMMIPAAGGRLVPFSSVADIEQGSAIASIKRVDGKREITVTSGAYTKDPVRQINREIAAFFDTSLKPLYPDVTLSVGGEFAELGSLLIQILRIFLIGIFLIYLILGAQFRSYTQPLLILLTIPYSLAGVILYLFISGTPFSTTVLYAGVALAGISVNDSIVLISFINELREKGSGVRDAILEAGTTRLRPILLTSLTTIAGLLPTAAGIGGRSVVWGPMASTIIFGLVFSTITALFVIPGVYGLLYDRKDPGQKRPGRKNRTAQSARLSEVRS